MTGNRALGFHVAVMLSTGLLKAAAIADFNVENAIRRRITGVSARKRRSRNRPRPENKPLSTRPSHDLVS